MFDLFIILAVIVVWLIRRAITEYKVDNYDIDNIDQQKMSMETGKNLSQIKKNLISGKYDKDNT